MKYFKITSLLKLIINYNESVQPITIKIHPHDFINAAKSLIRDKTWEKWDEKVT